jgi:hypothetical protein
MQQYKRYMVFTWFKHDNVSPFESIDGDFDTLLEANDCLQSLTSLYMNLGCVFDRIDGLVVTTKE